MAVSTQQVSVTTSATRLDPAGTSNFTRSFLVRNRGSVAVYVGASDVTTSTGVQLDAGESLTADLRTGETMHGIVASGTAVCHVMQMGGN